MLKKIVSGGQSGVDQAALAMAVEAGIKIGGWCPLKGCDENGKNIRIKYPELKEAKTIKPDERTRLNIDDSDGTLVIVPFMPLPKTIVDGTKLTIDYAIEKNKPHLIVSISNKDEAVEQILYWIEHNEIHVLNIGGPRESSWPGIYEETCQLLDDLFYSLKPQDCMSRL
ncbi:MAG: putative molybdenum carrier protein [Legionella sp.]|nr:putative molybdenum carrier protein [Legionella sp.]